MEEIVGCVGSRMQSDAFRELYGCFAEARNGRVEREKMRSSVRYGVFWWGLRQGGSNTATPVYDDELVMVEGRNVQMSRGTREEEFGNVGSGKNGID